MTTRTHRWRIRTKAAVCITALGALGTATAGASTRAISGSPAATSQWTTYGGSMNRSSVQRSSPPLRPLRERWLSAVLDGGIYGEPLIDNGRVYVGTENDSIYALNARTGRTIWKRSLGSPVPASMLPCGDIEPTVGITSTMVLDPSLQRIFASGEILVQGTIHHELAALSPATGAILFTRDLQQPGWTESTQLQRTGLGIDRGRVLVGFGGNAGDCGAYNGYLMGVPETNIGATLVFKVATQREGAIWAPSGTAVNNQGQIFLATGNGSSQSSVDAGDSVIELNSHLKQISSFTPTNWLQDNATDADLGSTSPILVSRHRVFMVGKETTGYLLNARRLGGVGGQLASTSVCFAQGGDAYRAPYVYVGCPRNGVTAVVVGANSVTVAWRASGAIGWSPTLAGGVVWSIGDGILFGLNPTSGAELAHIPVIPVEHFAAPSAGAGLLVVGGTDRVEAFEGPRGYR